MGSGGVPNRTIEVSYERRLEKKKENQIQELINLAKKMVKYCKVDGMIKTEEQNEIEIILAIMERLIFFTTMSGIGAKELEKEVRNI